MQVETSLRASSWPPSLPFAFDFGRPSPSSLVRTPAGSPSISLSLANHVQVKQYHASKAHCICTCYLFTS
jgi:hypothetical protein